MEKADVNEATPLVRRLLTNLLATIKSKDQTAIYAKEVIGWVFTNTPALLTYGQLGTPLDTCFNACRNAGADLLHFDQVRILLTTESPLTLGATMIRDRSIQLCMAHEGKIISGMVFTSRQDVDTLIDQLYWPFHDAEETAADTMDQMSYVTLVALKAAIINYLVETARPLPMMLDYEFHQPLPSLIISQRLYGDASRYDEIRNENKVVHPLFCPPTGKALAS